MFATLWLCYGETSTLDLARYSTLGPAINTPNKGVTLPVYARQYSNTAAHTHELGAERQGPQMVWCGITCESVLLIIYRVGSVVAARLTTARVRQRHGLEQTATVLGDGVDSSMRSEST